VRCAAPRKPSVESRHDQPIASLRSDSKSRKHIVDRHHDAIQEEADAFGSGLDDSTIGLMWHPAFYAARLQFVARHELAGDLGHAGDRTLVNRCAFLMNVTLQHRINLAGSLHRHVYLTTSPRRQKLIARQQHHEQRRALTPRKFVEYHPKLP
jgi:hypothetical protein